MSAAPAEPDDAESPEGEAAAPPPTRSKKKLIVIGAAAAVLLLAGGGGAYFMLRPAAGTAHAAAAPDVPVEAYVDVPALIVNLRSTDGATRLIKLHVLLVPTAVAKSEVVKARLPLVIDRFQPFLRELRPEDLAGSAALFRIKEELLLRANDAAGAGSVSDVLVQDLIQQ